jgi:hypothetical protein
MIFGEFLKKCTKFEAVGTAPKSVQKIFFMPCNRFSAYKSFPAKIQIFTFSLQYTVFPETDQEEFSRFGHARNRFPHKFTPIWVIFSKNIFRSKKM